MAGEITYESSQRCPVSEFLMAIFCLVFIPVRAALTPFAFVWDLVGIALEATGNYKRHYEINDISLKGKP